jgi:heat-inducible transcriptional repressor
MIDKKDFLLQSIIRAYIENLEPIGSSQLKSMYDISYSSATIRGYFKKLGEEGYLAQEHISSGRTPTIEALKEFWDERLNFELESVDYNKLKTLANNMGLTEFLQKQYINKLQRVLNVENIYMILEFNSFAVSIKYSAALHRFLNDMIDMNMDDILDVSKQVGAMQLHYELNKYIQKSEFEIVNIKNYLKFAVSYDLDEESIKTFMQGDIMQGLKKGVYFENMLPSGYIGVCHNTKINDDNVKILLVGALSQDFEYFYKGII